MNSLVAFLYNCLIVVYTFLIRVYSVFDSKAGLWIRGRRGIFGKIRSALENDPDSGKKTAWFHCASLGEFEQGRPLIEMFRSQVPDHQIILTFFSPSGYEVRKNYPGADHIFYLPADTRGNARKFIKLTNPSFAVFIKYEYWFNYLQELSERKIPVYLVSGIFRQDHYFFKWYGGWARGKLTCFAWFFLQDEDSKRLLDSAGFSNITVTGDTRFDRVVSVAGQVKPFPLVERFCEEKPVIIAGSSWPADEAVLFRFMQWTSNNIRYIIAPHETDPSRVDNIIRKCPLPAIKYAEATEENVNGARVLVIDTMGMLAHLYRYSRIAIIGGGFGSGIHNILEAAVFGVPVIFGPNHEKFREASDLVLKGGAFPVRSAEEFKGITDRLLDDGEYYRECSVICREYVDKRKGATKKIIAQILSI